MKKHFIGFAVFTFIVASTVLLSLFYLKPEVKLIPNNIYIEKTPTSCWRAKKQISESETALRIKTGTPISYQLQDLNYDAERKTVTGKIRLDWNGMEGEQPDAVTVKLNFFTLDKPSKEIQIASQTFSLPFEDSNLVTENLSIPIVNKRLIDPRENYYASAELWSFDKYEEQNSGKISGRITRTLSDESEKLAEAVPVTFVHEK